MRLFYFACFDLGASEGGCKLHVEGITCGLAKLGWDVTLFSVAEDIHKLQPEYPFKHVLIKRKRVSVGNELLYQLKLAFKLFFSKMPRPDAVYVRSSFMMFSPIAYARFFKIPFFYEINGIQANETGHRRLAKVAERIENWFLKKVTGIFCVTEELKKYFMGRTGLPENRFHVVHNGADPDIWPEGGLKGEIRDSFNIGYLGHFQSRQGLETVFQALAEIRNDISNVRLLIGGSGPEEERYRKWVNELGIEDIVDFAGFITKENIPAFLSKADVAVAPYTLEFANGSTGLSPIKMFTYLSCERVVVTSDISPLSDFRECPAVIFARPDDPDDFAQKIVGLLKMTEDQRNSLGKKARRFILDGYTWDHAAQKTAEKIKLWCKVLRK